jgi:hypothetical protein
MVANGGPPPNPNAAKRAGAREESSGKTNRRPRTDRGWNSTRGSASLKHISDHDFERYHLGMVTDETELARIEEHYLGCPECAKSC